MNVTLSIKDGNSSDILEAAYSHLIYTSFKFCCSIGDLLILHSVR